MYIVHPSARKLLLYCYLQFVLNVCKIPTLFAFHLELKLINFYSNKTSSTVIINISLSHFLCNLVNWFSSLKTVKTKNKKKEHCLHLNFDWAHSFVFRSKAVAMKKEDNKLFGKIIHYLHFISVTSYSGKEYRSVRVFDS